MFTSGQTPKWGNIRVYRRELDDQRRFWYRTGAVNQPNLSTKTMKQMEANWKRNHIFVYGRVTRIP